MGKGSLSASCFARGCDCHGGRFDKVRVHSAISAAASPAKTAQAAQSSGSKETSRGGGSDFTVFTKRAKPE